ncbi:hypothetical protein EVAR_48004_1 [Eumeta japonica]|uniref:Uncharacterized protein n=1 Tax=Eumeta variegata TaxID=151549 RepID=A0A4C1XP87_EUMVA|nr:hypothetical protein EVAR_48004_1 [Eumeta japonica]
MVHILLGDVQDKLRMNMETEICKTIRHKDTAPSSRNGNGPATLIIEPIIAEEERRGKRFLSGDHERHNVLWASSGWMVDGGWWTRHLGIGSDERESIRDGPSSQTLRGAGATPVRAKAVHKYKSHVLLKKEGHVQLPQVWCRASGELKRPADGHVSWNFVTKLSEIAGVVCKDKNIQSASGYFLLPTTLLE